MTKFRRYFHFCSISLLLSSAIPGILNAQVPNSLTKKEKKEGWFLLFDGKTLDGWHIYLRPTAKPGWSVSDGAIMTDFHNGGVRQDLVTNDEYENYELSLEWKIEVGGNSGIIFNVKEDSAYKATYLTGPEMQVLDNIKASDNQKDNHLAGSLYDLIAADPKPVHPAGEWNAIRIKMLNGHLTFWMNGEKVVDTQLWNAQWKALVAGSKFRNMPAFGSFRQGHIALQYHGGEVWFRNIKIHRL